MVAIVQGSNRRNSASGAIAEAIQARLSASGEQSQLLDLEHLPGSILHAGMYDGPAEDDFLATAEAALRAAPRWVFVFPEYNGSFPGALKLFVDALSVRNYQTLFGGHVAALVGTASGRAGNLRGIDHFTAVLHHLGTTVMPQSMPISLIDGLVTDGRLTDETTRAALHAYIDRLLDYAPLAALAEER